MIVINLFLIQGRNRWKCVLRASHTADPARITHKSRTYCVCACLCVENLTKCFGCRGQKSLTNHAWITHEPRTYVSFTITDISRWSTHTNKYGVVFHEHSTHARRINYWRSASKHARFANVSEINVIRALFMRDMKVGRQWTDVDVRYWTGSDA